MLSTALTRGSIVEVYHRLDVKTHRTFCGIQMPESYGRFTGQHTAPMQLKLRCSKCNELNEAKNRKRKGKVP